MCVKTLDQLVRMDFKAHVILAGHTGVLAHLPAVAVLFVLSDLPIHKQQGPTCRPKTIINTDSSGFHPLYYFEISIFD